MPGYETEVQKERDMKDEFMSRHPESPFLVGDATGFRGLAYYPVDSKYRISAVLERLDAPKEAYLRTNRDGQLTCRYIGDLVFSIDEQKLRLRVYHAGEQVGPSVFVPFRDQTCGEGSYEAGRYLILQLTEDDRYVLDFNLAFNPYCAYTERYECGFPPAENDLPIGIPAGEMAWIAGPLPEFVEGPSSDVGDDEPEERPTAHPAPKNVPRAPMAKTGTKKAAPPAKPAPRAAPARKSVRKSK